MSDKRQCRCDVLLVRIRQHCITSVPSLDKSPSPLRLFPPYPWPLTRCIQAKFSRVRSITMTTSGFGLQQHGVFPIGAIAGELAIPQPPIRRDCNTCSTRAHDVGHRRVPRLTDSHHWHAAAAKSCSMRRVWNQMLSNASKRCHGWV